MSQLVVIACHFIFVGLGEVFSLMTSEERISTSKTFVFKSQNAIPLENAFMLSQAKARVKKETKRKLFSLCE
jgi:hypothetical protein